MEALDLSGLNDVLKNLFNYVLGFLSDLGPHLLELTSGIVSMVVTGVLSWSSPSICSPAGTPS